MAPKATFTPVDVAQALHRFPRIFVPETTRGKVMAAMRSVGISPVAAPLDTARPGPAQVRYSVLLADPPHAKNVAQAWLEMLDSPSGPTVAEALLLEMYFAAGTSSMQLSLPSGFRYLKTLHVIRERTAIALYDYARDINWRRPMLFTQTLKLARGYLRGVVGLADQSQEKSRREFTGRLGVSTVLIGRFEAISCEDADEAIDALRLSLQQGNKANAAVPYLIEAANIGFDLRPDTARLLSFLSEGVEAFGRGPFELSAPALLAACDTHLRVASSMHDRERTAAVDRARSCADKAVRSATDVDDRVRGKLLVALTTELATNPKLFDQFGVRGVSLPFGTRMAAGAPPLVKHLAISLLNAIADDAARGEPLARGAYADLLELTARREDPALLQRIVTLRGSTHGRRTGADERSVLLSLRDKLVLASVQGRDDLRVGAVTDLIATAASSPTSPAPILLIAHDVEVNGPVRNVSSRAAGSSDLRDAAASGDWEALLRIAARRAVESPDLAALPLGGRSGVTTAGDYYGLVSQTFIFKEMYSLALQRERPRAERLRKGIEANGLDDCYLVSEYLDAIPKANDKVLSIRRFVSGRPIASVAADASTEQLVLLLARTAAYLGFINSIEGGKNEGVRKDLKEIEVGRWCRAIGVSQPLPHFELWWALVSGVDVVCKRDAHLDNWVLTSDDRILAVDLEAVGSRPVGYELAQITDDMALIDPGDWATRRRIFDAYRGARNASDANSEVEWNAYLAAVAARALRKLTWSEASPREQEHARDLLESISQSSATVELRRWTVRTLDAWRKHRGLAKLSRGELDMDPHRRRRISKSMAYHLRHGSDVRVDPDGWASQAELALSISNGVSETEVAIVASTLAEPRFEFRDNMIRARYGHSRSVPRLIRDLKAVDADQPAFHATNLESAHRIIELGEGLRPMERQLVHLSADPREAFRSGLRHGSPLLLAIDTSKAVDVMKVADETLVCPSVEAAAIRIEPISTHWAAMPRVQLAKH